MVLHLGHDAPHRCPVVCNAGLALSELEEHKKLDSLRYLAFPLRRYRPGTPTSARLMRRQ